MSRGDKFCVNIETSFIFICYSDFRLSDVSIRAWEEEKKRNFQELLDRCNFTFGENL